MLLEMQRAFRATVMGQGDLVTPHVHAARGPLAGRIAIYRNTVQQSLVDILATAFPAVQRIVGPKFFAALARDFIVHHPPDVPQLSKYGTAFAGFIETHERVRELDYLADIARLEWARSEAYFAADSLPLDPALLSSALPEQLPSFKFTLHPACRLITSNRPIHLIWMVNQPEVIDVPAIDMTVPESVIVTRPQYEVTVRLISSADAAFVTALSRNQPLGAAVVAAMHIDAGFDLQAALQQHFIHGTFYSAA